MYGITSRLVFSIIALMGAEGQAGPCPQCPQGCIPEALVQEFREAQGGDTIRCPKGCAPTRTVRVLRDVPGCEEAAASEAEPAPAMPVRQEAAAGAANVDSTQNRGVLLSTALSAPVGQTSLTGIVGGLWDVEYSLTDEVQVGGYVILPVYVMGFFPGAKFQHRVTGDVSFGFGALAGIAGLYAGSSSGDFVVVFAGHSELSHRAGPHILNLGFAVATGGTHAGRHSSLDMLNGVVLLPNAAYRNAFSRNWSFEIEATSPLIILEHEGYANKRPEFVIAYGFRGHGDSVFGDIGFFFPIYQWYLDEVWKYFPIGIPYFSIGFKF